MLLKVYHLIFISIILTLAVFSITPESRDKAIRLIYKELTSDVFNINKHADLVSITTSNTETNFHCLPSSKIYIPISVTNYSLYPLISSARSDPEKGIGVNLGFRIFDETNEKVIIDGRRHYFEPPISDRMDLTESVRNLTFPIECPNKPGSYQLRIELVQEGVNWQSQVASESSWLRKKLHVLSSEELMQENINHKILSNLDPDFNTLSLAKSDQVILKKAFQLARNIVSLSAMPLRVNNKTYLVTNAGSQYPMIWLRDMATIQESYFLLSPTLKPKNSHWSELFLAKQLPSGSVVDWLAFEKPIMDKWSDKNTVQSDQELWLVLSVLRAIETGNLAASWLQQKTSGITNKNRLLKSIHFLTEERFYNELGCIWTGHIADWGDVGLKGGDSLTSTKIEYGSPKVCGLFIQSLFVTTVNNWLKHPVAQVRESLLPKERLYLEDVSDRVKNFVRKSLWNTQGYFAIHRHIEPFHHSFNEDMIFALGGNLLTIIADIPDQEQKLSILKYMTKRNRPIGEVLTPPYPLDTFANPIMSQPYEYQNGGDWDWYGAFAAELIYDYDKSAAIAALMAIAKKVVANKTFHEWDQPNGLPGAGPHFQAGAARFISAIYHIIDNNKKAQSH